MGDTSARVGTRNALQGPDSNPYIDGTAAAKQQFVPYRTQEFTPPASPQPRSPYALKHEPASRRPKHALELRMDTAVSPVHDIQNNSTSPASSPTLPPLGLPSPKFPSRQRAPSLLRHAAVPSPTPTHTSHPRSDQTSMSPIMAPAMMRQGSGPGSPDLRAIFNPLASNPVNSTGPQWDSMHDNIPHSPTTQRSRGLTSSSQSGFHPPLRSMTSNPDYGPLRSKDRANLSGTYKPNRGVPNWSHTDYYPPPPRYIRGEEPRASFRSGWTNGSSSVMEASGTERSSIVTARSSIVSERQNSIYSRDQSQDRLRDRDDSPETIQTQSEIFDDDDDIDAVEDVIDAYCYDEEEGQGPSTSLLQLNGRNRFSSSPTALDSEPPELSQTPSRDLDSLSSFHSSDHLQQWDERPASYLQDATDSMDKPGSNRDPTIITPSSVSSPHGTSELQASPNPMSAEQPNMRSRQPEFAQVDSVHNSRARRQDRNMLNEHNDLQIRARKRSSEDSPRRMSTSLQALALGGTNTMSSMNPSLPTGHRPHGSNLSQSKMVEIRRDISALPQIPVNKSRLSRQDWANIEAYSRRHSKRPSASRTLSNDSCISRSGMQSPPLKQSQPLPEVDEDEAIPRRASTSVYDRKSALFNLGMMAASGSNMKSPTTRGPAEQSGPTPAKPTPSVVRKLAAPAERDRYGFKKASDKINVQQYNAWSSKYEEHISRRRNKWIQLMSKQGLPTTDPVRFPDMCDKVKRYARKGYPPEWRGAMWWYYSGGQHTISQKEMVGLYASLVIRVRSGELNKDDKDAIERDLDRTFPDNIHFRPEPSTDLLDGDSDEEPKLIQDLREVLSCFALNNPGIGYCQSLNFIAGLLLLFLKQDKERAFIMLTIITQNHLPGAHARNLANTEVNVLMMLIKDYLPKVWASINDTDLINSGAGSAAHPNSKFQRQPTVALSCTSWFMSIFVGVLPIETVLRVWDAFLYEGPRALYRYALAIFKLGEPEIRKYRPSDPELFMIVQNLPRTCLDPNVLHDLAFVKKGFGNLTQGVIDQKRLFWREQTRLGHQTSVRKQQSDNLLEPPKGADEDTDNDSTKKSMNGLRRRASRRFRRMRS